MAAGDWKDLYSGCIKGDYDLVSYYLEEGIDPNYQHPEVLVTPIIEACRNGHLDIVKLLLAYEADPLIKSEIEGIDAVQAAQQAGQQQILALLPAIKKKRKWFQI